MNKTVKVLIVWSTMVLLGAAYAYRIQVLTPSGGQMPSAIVINRWTGKSYFYVAGYGWRELGPQ